MKEDLKLHTKVTKINNNWHVRLLKEDGTVFDEMACDNQQNISYCCAEMLRWASKNGWINEMAEASRRRQKTKKFEGKIWYKGKLPR